MARSDWTIREESGAYVVYWRDRRWISEPFLSREWAEEYILRVCTRYAGDSPEIFLGEESKDQQNRQRGGPWRYSYPNGDGPETGVIHTSTKADAKDILRRKLDRKRLPAGIEWEIEQELPPV